MSRPPRFDSPPWQLTHFASNTGRTSANVGTAFAGGSDGGGGGVTFGGGEGTGVGGFAFAVGAVEGEGVGEIGEAGLVGAVAFDVGGVVRVGVVEEVRPGEFAATSARGSERSFFGFGWPRR
jgi:hypothetical protein